MPINKSQRRRCDAIPAQANGRAAGRPAAWVALAHEQGLKARFISLRDEPGFQPLLFISPLPRPLAWAGITSHLRRWIQ